MIKSTEAAAVKGSEYPKLMIGVGVVGIVLFSKPGCGTVIRSGCHSVGYSETKWNMDCFEDYTGKITLENDND